LRKKGRRENHCHDKKIAVGNRKELPRFADPETGTPSRGSGEREKKGGNSIFESEKRGNQDNTVDKSKMWEDLGPKAGRTPGSTAMCQEKEGLSEKILTSL